jgi:WD40 repeat protein
VELGDLATKKLAGTLTGQGTGPAAAFSPDGRLLVTAGDHDHTVKVWDVKTRQVLVTLNGRTGPFNSVTFSPDGRTLATGGMDHSVALWGLTPRRASETIPGQRGYFGNLAFSPNGETLAFIGASGPQSNIKSEVKLWDAATRRGRALLKERAGIYGLAFSPDGRRLAANIDRPGPGGVKLWDLSPRPVVAAVLRVHQPASRLLFSPDGRTLAMSEGNAIQLWDAASGRSPVSLRTQGVIINDAFSPDGRTLATVTPSSFPSKVPWAIQLWDLKTRRVRAVFNGGFLSVAFSPDGKLLAGGGFGSMVKLWDLATGQAVATLIGHLGQVSIVRFSPDGKTLASGGDDGLIQLWNVATREQVATLRGRVGAIYSMEFSPDGNLLASEGDDEIIRLWRAASFAETDAPAGGTLRHEGGR